MRNRYVAHMETEPTATLVERTTTLAVDCATAREAMLDPELLSAWLGAWTPQRDGSASVRTDDGVLRRVTGHHVDEHGDVRWTWSAEDGSDGSSQVVVRFEQVGDSTRVVVREATALDARLAPNRADATTAGAATASVFGGVGDRWTSCLLALGAVLERHRQLVVV